MSPPSLPTPAPSTEIPPGKRTSFSTIDNAFSLPPAAIANSVASSAKSNSSGSSTSSVASAASDSSYQPVSPVPIAPSQPNPSRGEKAPRRRSSGTNNQNSNSANASGGYTLPPPPTRSRKIIQMTPRTGQEGQSSSANTSPILNAKTQPSPSITGQTTPKASASSANTGAGTKRKQANGSTTAAGRKIARKTAHSLIERRRRSKMNEEFGVLKDMIPACAGQDMHKLQVLSASIEYMRYLERCLAELKAIHALCPPQNTQPTPVSPFRQPSSVVGSSAASAVVEDDDDDEEDEDMIDVVDDVPTPQHRVSGYSSNHPSVSPAIPPSSHHTTPQLYPSTHTSPAISSSQIRANYNTFTPTFPGSGLPSPVFSANPAAPASGYTTGGFKLTSPALGPQRQISSSELRQPQSQPQRVMTVESGERTPTSTDKDDHEATAALLMLNTDRRSWSGLSGPPSASARTPTNGSGKGDGGRGMSVRDLLSG